MRIKRDEIIAGLPAVEARDLARWLKSRQFDRHTIAHKLGWSEDEAGDFLGAFQREGFVVSRPGSTPDVYELSMAGNALAMATTARPIKRSTAKAAIDQLLQRVEQVNADPSYLFSVDQVVLFGSYLTRPDDDYVGDVDLAIALSSRWEGAEMQRRSLERVNLAIEQGRRFDSFIDELGWPEIEVLRFLKGRSRVLSLTRTNDSVLQTATSTVIYARRVEQ